MGLTDARPAIIGPEGRTSGEWLSMGEACLNVENGRADYEQAAFCFGQAAALGHHVAASRLEALARDHKGIAVAAPAIDEITPSVFSRGTSTDYRRLNTRQRLECNQDRCPSCGATVFRKHPHPDGGFVCAHEEGGCGGRLYIPVIEDGLRAGLAIQPYKEQQNPVVYSYFGRCVHEVKYDTALSEEAKRELLDEAVQRIRECCVIENLMKGLGTESMVVTPAPSSRYRRLQPVHYLAQGIAQGHLEYAELLRKRSNVESKDRPSGTELADGDVTCNYMMGGRSVLIVDDTYGDGATLRACLKALRQSGAGNIFFLSLCRNIFGGMKGRR